MYVTTFYSFKGGVGRTMALVNVAVDLANRGKKVLVVDFDLEAPGLDTFNLLRPVQRNADNEELLPERGRSPGIVDFVDEFRKTCEAPDVRDFLVQAPGPWTPNYGQETEDPWPASDDNMASHFRSNPPSNTEGAIWLMPSGLQDENYSQRLTAIDWSELYEHQDGYLLFEDLKLQWQHTLNPDYVLIDSRTGHTDVGGICTRQLPDAVALLMFPNEQNLRGIAKVDAAIAREATGPARKTITCHYVLSNVPDLDDESHFVGSLHRRMALHFAPRGCDPRDFRSITIHHYPSPSLLAQSVVVRDRPLSRLAREYAALAQEIVVGNPKDRQGALRYISERLDTEDLMFFDIGRRQIEAIKSAHWDDGTVLLRLGQALQDKLPEEELVGDVQPLPLFERAIELGESSPWLFLYRAEARLRQGDRIGAHNDARVALENEGPYREEQKRAARRGGYAWIIGDSGELIDRALRVLANEEARLVLSNPAVRSLEPLSRVRLAENSSYTIADAAAGTDLLSALIRESPNLPDNVAVRAHLALMESLLAQGEHDEALGQLKPCEGRPVYPRELRRVYLNEGMARWAANGELDRRPFELALEMAADEKPWPSEASHLQASALGYWALGDASTALKMTDSAGETVKARTGGRLFSYWRYLNATPKTFLHDLDAMRELIAGDDSVVPAFAKARPATLAN